MEGNTAPERPSYRFEQQVGRPALRRSTWSACGTCRSYRRARKKAAGLCRPCRIVELRVVWRSVTIA